MHSPRQAMAGAGPNTLQLEMQSGCGKSQELQTGGKQSRADISGTARLLALLCCPSCTAWTPLCCALTAVAGLRNAVHLGSARVCCPIGLPSQTAYG